MLRNLRGGVGLWRRSVGLVFAAAPWQATAMVVLMALQAALPAATLFASRGVVDAAAQTVTGGSASASTGGLPLGAWIALAVAALVAQQLLGPLAQAAQEAAGDRLVAHANGALIAAASRWHGLARFEDPAFANHLAVARQRAARSPLDLVSYGGRFVQSVFTIAAMCALLWQVHPLAPLLLVLAHVPRALQENEFAQNMANAYMVHTADGRKLGSYKHAVLDAPPAKDVRLFDLGDFFGRLYDGLFARMTDELWGLRRRLMRRMVPAQVLGAGAAAAIYVYAVHAALAGALTPGDLVLAGGALLQIEGALAMAAFDVGFFAMIFTWLPSLFLVLDAGPDLPLAAPERAAAAPEKMGIALEHVSFRYPGAAADALLDLNLTVRPGERIALVGRNGAGKTTLVKLLARLYDPTEGRILVDGRDLREYDLDELRRRIGVIFQDFVRYELTAQENIGLGDAARLDDLGWVQEAARKGGADEVIARLPHGYATRLGSQFGGVPLSGGEWQKVALSRAFMRDARLLMLDEPTAALDVRAEYEVYQRFSELTRGATTVLVSHRFSTVRMADRICYLEDGRLAEVGAHAELMALGGGYARLYQLQAELYQ